MMMLLCIRIQKQWKQIKAACRLLPGVNETLFKIFFWINETNIYTTTWSSRCSQSQRFARLNTSASRYISWRQIWYICLTVVIFWLCLRFRNVEIKYLRKIGVCIPKYTTLHWTYSALHYWEWYGLFFPWN